jgi:hypothetical protein
MKINGSGGVTPSGPSSTARRGAAEGGFKLPTEATQESAPATRVAAAGPVGSIDALLALQEADGPMERKRRAVGRAGRMLDVLDEVKLALLGGETTESALQRLTRAVRDQRAMTDDPALEGVLDEVETRAAVELAKAEMSRVAA